MSYFVAPPPAYNNLPKPVVFENESDVSHFYPPVQTTIRGKKPGGLSIIQKRAKEDAITAAQAADTKLTQQVAYMSKWHANHARQHKENSRLRTALQQELDEANNELIKVRRAKLSELLNLEQKMWEKELAAKGLAILPNF